MPQQARLAGARLASGAGSDREIAQCRDQLAHLFVEALAAPRLQELCFALEVVSAAARHRSGCSFPFRDSEDLNPPLIRAGNSLESVMQSALPLLHMLLYRG